MAIEDNLDQLYAEMIANRIICSRFLGFMAEASGDEKAWLARQEQQSVESADLWRFEGHRDPENMRRMIKAALRAAFKGIVRPAPPGTPVQ